MFNLSNDRVVSNKRLGEESKLSQAKVMVLEDVVRQIKAERDLLREQVQAWKTKLGDVKQQWQAESKGLETASIEEKESLVEKQKQLMNETEQLKSQLSQQQKQYQTQMKELRFKWSQEQSAYQQQQSDQESLIESLELQVQELQSSLDDAAQEMIQLKESMAQQQVKLLQKQEQKLAKARDEWNMEQEESMQIASAAVKAAQDREQSAVQALSRTKARVATLKQNLEQQNEKYQRLLRQQEQAQNTIQQQRDLERNNDLLRQKINELEQKVAQLSTVDERLDQKSSRPGILGRIKRKILGRGGSQSKL